MMQMHQWGVDHQIECSLVSNNQGYGDKALYTPGAKVVDTKACADKMVEIL